MKYWLRVAIAAWAVFTTAVVAMHVAHAWDTYAYSRTGIHFFWMKMLTLFLSPAALLGLLESIDWFRRSRPSTGDES